MPKKKIITIDDFNLIVNQILKFSTPHLGIDTEDKNFGYVFMELNKVQNTKRTDIASKFEKSFKEACNFDLRFKKIISNKTKPIKAYVKLLDSRTLQITISQDGEGTAYQSVIELNNSNKALVEKLHLYSMIHKERVLLKVKKRRESFESKIAIYKTKQLKNVNDSFNLDIKQIIDLNLKENYSAREIEQIYFSFQNLTKAIDPGVDHIDDGKTYKRAIASNEEIESKLNILNAIIQKIEKTDI